MEYYFREGKSIRCELDRLERMKSKIIHKEQIWL